MPLDVMEWDGKPITRPGVYNSVPAEIYHNDPNLFGGDPHLSSTGLRKIEDPEGSLEHFWDSYVMNPGRKEPEDTSHYAFGRAVHTLFLGEKGFKEQFVIRPETYPDAKIGQPKAWHGASNWCKDWLLAEKNGKGRAVLSPDQLEDIKNMAVRLGAHPLVKEGLLNGLVEKSIFWFRDVALEDGRVVRVWLKARPDVLPTDSLMIGDYKTAASADPISVRRSLTELGYHQQLALGQEGLWVTTGRLSEDHILLFQEKTRPYSVNVKPLFPSAIHAGHLQNARALGRFAKAWADNEWPGYEDDECSCDLMEWRVKQLQQEIKDGRLPEDFELPKPYVATALALPAPEPKRVRRAEPDLEEAL